MLNTLLGLTNFATPLRRVILPSIGAAIAIQAAAGIPSIAAQTERFYDFSGSLTFLAVGALSLYLPALRARTPLPSILAALKGTSTTLNWRQVVLTSMVGFWAMRLGTYLLRRVHGDGGKDARFDKIRGEPLKFGFAFFMQAMWVSLMLMPVMAVNAVPAAAFAALPRVLATDVLGMGAWAAGWAFESIADAQKSEFIRGKKNKEHDEAFMKAGLFSLCRFPHYFGEISLWTGIATAAAGILARQPVQAALGLAGPAGIATTTALAFVAPAFSAFLLTCLSGIPMTEQSHDKKYGERRDYQEWKKNTPKLIPNVW